MTKIFRCGTCKATGVRLYRPYGSVFRAEDNECNACVAARGRDHMGWMVPLCSDEDGSIWGYTSVPPKDHNKFLLLPEKDPTTWSWDRFWVICAENLNRFRQEGWRNGQDFLSADILLQGKPYFIEHDPELIPD